MLLPESIISLFEFLILFASLFIVSTTTIGHIIAAYRVQTALLGVLALVILYRSWIHFIPLHFMSIDSLFITALIFWPVLLFFLIKRALMLATVSETKWRINMEDQMEIHRVWTEASFREDHTTMSRTGVAMAFFLALLVFAFVVALQFTTGPEKNLESIPNRVGLGVALALQLAGLFTMMTKREIISQVVGLFVMDHGMYLAMIVLTDMPFPAAEFLLALYLYTFITIMLLFFILPNLRRIKGRIDLDALSADSKLKG